MNPDDPEFKKLKAEWYLKLKDSGFKDQEYSNEQLKDLDRRTISFENREVIADFSRKLDHYLTNTKRLPANHRQILTLFASGIHIKGSNGIAEQVGLHFNSVYKIIKKYHKVLQSL